MRRPDWTISAKGTNFDTKVVIYGQSIGGAVAIGLAARNLREGDISGIILENTFTSIKKLIPT